MSRYAILGARGMLGRAFIERLAVEKREGFAVDRNDLDLGAKSTEFSLLDAADIVINCAAHTNVDGAESEEELASEVNGFGVGRLAKYCEKTKKKLVHFSTDYVFDGLASSPYEYDHPRRPLNAYGRSKALGEELLERSNANFLCLRTSWVYAPWGKNFVLTMKKLLAEKTELRVVSDQRGRPSSALELAKNTFRLLDVEAEGILHLTDSGACSWYEFTAEIQRQLGTSCALVPCTSDEFPRPAKRPAHSVLDLEATEALIPKPLDYREALAMVLSRS